MSLKNMFDHLLGFNMSILTKKNTLGQRFTQITNVHKSLKNSTDSVCALLPNGPPLIQKRHVTDAGPQLTF